MVDELLGAAVLVGYLTVVAVVVLLVVALARSATPRVDGKRRRRPHSAHHGRPPGLRS